MKIPSDKKIVQLIALVAGITLLLQVYWNIKNYEENKKRLLNEVQIAFDNSVNTYFAEAGKEDIIAFISEGGEMPTSVFIEALRLDTLFEKKSPKKTLGVLKKTDSFQVSTNLSINSESLSNKKKENLVIQLKDTLNTIEFDLSDKIGRTFYNTNPNNEKPVIKVLKGQKSVDSINRIKSSLNRLVISMTRDSIEFTKLDKMLLDELDRKKINIFHQIRHKKNDSILHSFPASIKKPLQLTTHSQSSFIKEGEALELHFSNPVMILIKRGFWEILFSFIFFTIIIGSLLFLLKIINKQKKVDEIKNDFISNITHELKTPITTISTALEGIRYFNPDNDTETTRKYIDISGKQLKKLEKMVEKILETATLSNDQLTLDKTSFDLTSILKESITKFSSLTSKKIHYDMPDKPVFLKGDCFHIEQVFSNLIDNAIKYGGEIITIKVYEHSGIVIDCIDSGKGIEKTETDKIFDKFYRIPKGNIHDIKGFGIGLYYARKIIEKHNGTLEYIKGNETTFRIKLPHEA